MSDREIMDEEDIKDGEKQILPNKLDEETSDETPTPESETVSPASILHAHTAPRPNAMRHSRCVSFGGDVDDIHKEQEGSPTTNERSSDEDEYKGDSVRPSLLDDRRRTSMLAMESFRQSMRSFDVSELRDDCAGSRWKPWTSWSMPRFQWTAVGCFSSMAVLTIRLLLDIEPTAYLIHSIIVFLDMVLIHLFTNSPWLSISGEFVTVVCFLAFHFTKETLYELLETTLIAVLCSFHLILSRNKAKDRNQKLETDLNNLRQTSFYLLRNVDIIDPEELGKLEENSQVDSVRTAPGGRVGWLAPLDPDHYKEKLKVFGENFFEHFLDGSAGVMYTSFLGLIIDELLTYGDGTKGY